MTASSGEAAALQARLTAWADRALPNFAPLTITGLTRAQGGFSSDTWLIAASVAGGGAVDWVLRVQSQRTQVYEDPSVLRQYRMMQAIAAHSDIPVPGCIAYEADPDVLGAPFFLMERISGEVPPHSYHTQGVWFDAAPAEREAMWLASIEQMAKLHALDPAPFAFLGYGDAHPTDGVGQELARWDSYLGWSQIPSYPVVSRARQWLDDTRPAAVGPDASRGVAWGDARPCNILFAGTRCAALLDFETASLGGGETDLGWWLFFEHMITDAIGVPRLAGIGDRAATIAAWEGFSGRRARDMDWHEVFATYRFALVSERAIALAIAAGLAREQDRGAGNVAVRRLGQLLA